MQLQFFSLSVFILILLSQSVFSQCTITSCPNPVIFSGEANWVDGVEGVSNGELTISGITLGNVDCAGGDAGVGIDIYIYQLLPDGSRIALCNLANGAPDNFVFKYSIGIGSASDCTDTAFDIPEVQLFDHEDTGNSATMFLCDGGMYEIMMVVYVTDESKFIPDELSVYSVLNSNQYAELNLGTFFVNYTNEFETPNPYPIPITTAVITGPNGETGTMAANCGENVSLFFEGLSYIGRCRFDEESIPNFYPFCDPSDPMMNETYSPSITSETENFISYTINGGTPVIIRNGNGGDPNTDAYGGQQTGPGNLPGLGANECYTGICGVRAIPAPESICAGDELVVTIQTVDIYTGLTVEDQMTITYSGEGCNDCGPICPTEANISASSSETCSGESITINGTTMGEGSATFTITESSGAIAEISEGTAFTLPENRSCSSIIYTFNAMATCNDDGNEITNGTLSIDVIVYPTDISAFVTVNDGECSTGVSLDASCGTNIIISPSESQTANAGESGTHNYTASWVGGGPSCVSNVDLTATYNCPPDVVCPTSAEISASLTEVCSGENITINGSTTGEGSATFNLTENSGAISSISEGMAFSMPENNTCAPVTYTFSATATCIDDGSEITNGTLSVEVTVYPSNINAFVTANDGTCSTNITIDDSCASNISISPSESQMANSGESGIHNYTASWSGGGPNCVTNLPLMPAYNCIACPTEASISASVNEVCSGESVVITGTTVGEGTASFEITDESGSITEITKGVVFNMPANTTCAPVTYTFTAVALCDDDNSEIPGGLLSVDITVYPTQIANFVSITKGDCSTSVAIDPSCASNIGVSPSESQSANPGESGTHDYIFSWIGDGPNCVPDETLLGNYNCPPDIICPESASITANATELCSTGSIIISGEVSGAGEASFTITESTGIFVNIREGENIDLPENLTCNPITYTFNATATCVADGNEINNGTQSVDITVYPSDISAFISSNDGECSTSVSIDVSCGTNVSINPSESQTANTGESGTHNYTASWTGGGSSCSPDVDLMANYNCPPDIVCPTEANIITGTTETCSGESITISGTTMGEGSATFTITESSGSITEISEGTAFTLPENTTCSPITYTFTATAICVDDGSEITNGNLSIDVTVYPIDISAFITSSDGECSTSVSIDESCGTNVSINPSESQTANPGESGTHIYGASWVGGGPCEMDIDIAATYNCPTEISCPASANISANVSELCATGSIIISGSTVGEGEASFTIIETSGIITNITEGENIDLPENITCNPITYTFNATAICLDDDSEITTGNLSVEVTVYPSDISAFITSNDGECSTSISIDESCGNNISISPALSQTAIPGESGTHNYTTSWTGGGPSCFTNEMLTANYNCPTEVVCPTAANITVNLNEICSGESVVILGEYEGEGAAIYSIIETSGLVTGIESGVALILPENNTCMPTTYSFELTVANCVADGSTVPVNQSTVEVTVYPSDISSYISTIENNCITTVNIAAVCEDLLTVFPASEQFAEPGTEAGMHDYTISWNGGGACITNTELSLNYTCDCVFDPSLAEIELVSGSTNVCFGNTIEYKAKYDGIDRDLAVEGGLDESYNAAFIIFIEPIDLNQPMENDAIYRITNDTILENDDTIEPGTYYIYYFQGQDINDPINDESLCLLYSQDFIVVEILPEITSGESVCSGHNGLNEVTISVADGSGSALPNNAYVESNGVQYTYETIEVVDTTKIVTFINLPDGYYFFYYEDAQGCSSTDLLTEFNCESQAYNCPTEIEITGVQLDQCSEAIIDLQVDSNGSSDFTTITWFDELGNTLTDPSAVSLPVNSSCYPIYVTYSVEVGCTQNPDFVSLTDMITITVYPNDISTFLSPSVLGCTASLTVSMDCSDALIIIESQTFSAGESGIADVIVSYVYNPCINYSVVNVPYDCPPEAGCTDPCASNYDPNATVSDNSCEPYENTCNEDCTLGDLTVWDETTCSCIAIETVEGCIDANACNYNENANCDDGSCVSSYSACADPCNAPVCEEDEIFNSTSCECVRDTGCTDPCAPNYNPNAPDDGICLPYDTTCNDDCTLGDITVFDPAVCSCVVSIVTVNGCTDSNACNYNSEANCDDDSCTYTTCNEDGCNGNIEAVDPNDACACVVVEAQNIGCDDPAAVNYDATVNCSDRSDCIYETAEISIAELCYCDNEMNIDLDGDGNIDLVAEEIRITGPTGDIWSLTANNNPQAVDIQNMVLPVDGSVVASEITQGIYSITVYHSANGTGFGSLTFTSNESNETLQITNSDGCDCSVDCAPPIPGNFECDE